MNRFQLDLLDLRNPEEFRSSEPVPEPDGTGSSGPVPAFSGHEGPKTAHSSMIPAGTTVPNRYSGFASNVSELDRFQNSPLRGDTNPGTDSDTQAPQAGKRVIATLSLPADLGGRGQAPLTTGAEAEKRLEPAGTAPTLRPYQATAVAAVERELEQHRSTLLVLPTGCGKTVVFAELARHWVAAGDRTLVLAHRTELLDQAARKLADVGVTTSIDQGQRIGSRWSDVVIGSVQTLQRARLARYPHDFFRRIIVDEAHHAAAKSYGNVLEWFPDAKVLGVTATPDRGDGKGLGKCFESLAFTYEMRVAIADGFLSPLVAKRVLVKSIDLAKVKNRAGDFAQDELSKVLNDANAVAGVVGPLLEMAGDRRTLVFGVDVAHAKAIAEGINDRKPGKAIALDGTASSVERAAVLELFRRGTFQFLVNCALFTEGFDEPSIQCVALARPTQSRALYTQMLGRGTRLFPGKTECLVLDFVGNCGKHRLIGPADALAGTDLDEKTRKIVEENLDGQQTLEEVLAHAEEEAKKRARRVNDLAIAEYRIREVDLFLGDHMPDIDTDSDEAKRPMTDAQRAEFERLKLGKPPQGFSEAEANAMFIAIRKRRALGLCTVAQARALERLKVNTKGMKFARANELITMVVTQNAWNAPWRVFSGIPEFQPGRRP